MRISKKHSSSSSAPELDLGEVEQLLSFMNQHGLEEFEYASGDFRIRLKKASGTSGGEVHRVPHVPAESAVQSPAAHIAGRHAAPPPEPAAQAPAATPADDLYIVKSPIVGTFYASPNPESDPFVKVGDFVEAGRTVCIVEAMKLMNEIESEISGEVVRILVENGQPVEYGEPLFALRPAGKK